MKNENKKFYVTFTAQVDGEYKKVPVGRGFRNFDLAESFADSAMKAWEKSSLFQYTGYTVSFR
jgi:hypothetical protein